MGTEAAVLTILSAIIVVLIVAQLVTGVSFLHHQTLKVTRQSDPFAFWLSITVQVGAVLILGGGGVSTLLQWALR